MTPMREPQRRPALRTQELMVLSFYRALGFRPARRWRLGPWSVLLLAL